RSFGGLASAGVEPRAAYSFVMNQAIPAGATLAELARVVKEPDLTRASVEGAVAASANPGFTADEFLAQKAVSDTTELEPLIERILAANPGVVEAHRGAKER